MTNNKADSVIGIEGRPDLSPTEIANTIIAQIRAGDRYAMGAWGSTDLVALDSNADRSGGLQFAVRGHKLHGKVVVELTWLDVYKVSFWRKRRGQIELTLVETIDDIYCEDLMRVIDGKVER